MNSVDFLKFYVSVEEVFIEFIPDKYIEHQPINETEFVEKIIHFRKIIKDINDYCRINRKQQVVILDCDKCVNVLRINLVLFAKAVRDLARVHKNADMLAEVQVIHSNKYIKALYNGLKPLIPSEISELVVLY